MISFSIDELLHAVICAAIFGAGYSALLSVLKPFLKMVLDFPISIINAFKNKGRVLDHNKSEIKPDGFAKRLMCWLYVFFAIHLFWIGFMLLSYYALDGTLRLYMLAIAVLSFYIAKKSVCLPLKRLSYLICSFILDIITVILRIIFLPVKKIIAPIFKRLYKSKPKRKQRNPK